MPSSTRDVWSSSGCQAVCDSAQQATNNSHSSTASSSTSSVSTPVLQVQKFTFLAAKMINIHVENIQGPSPQQQLDKYVMELQSYRGASGKEFWMEHQAMYHSLAPLVRARYGVRARRSCVGQFLVVFERHIRQLTLRLAQHVCRRFVLSAERCMLCYRRIWVIIHICMRMRETVSVWQKM